MVLPIILSLYISNNPFIFISLVIFLICIGYLSYKYNIYNLNKLTVKELRKQCKDKNIKIKGYKKQDYIDAILDYETYDIKKYTNL
jgi:hypothetical protein